MTDAYERLLTTADELAAAKFGKGSCTSVDRDTSGFFAIAWDSKGFEALKGPSDGKNRADAVRKLIKEMKK